MSDVATIEKDKNQDTNFQGTDLFFVQIAREIAINHHTLPEICRKYRVTASQMATVIRNRRFQQLLSEEIASWQSAKNTPERTKLKAAAIMEDWLPEAHAKMHDKTEPLPAKTEVAKLVARIAGLGMDKALGPNETGEKFSVTINLGADNQLKFSKDITPPSKHLDAQDQ